MGTLGCRGSPVENYWISPKQILHVTSAGKIAVFLPLQRYYGLLAKS